MALIDQLTPEKLRHLIVKGETNQLEFKLNPPRQSELSERICGMANTSTGGIILFGVEENGNLVGIEQPNLIADELLKAARALKPPVNLTTPEPLTFVIDGKNIVAIEIPGNSGVLYQCNTRGFLIRKGSHTIPMSLEEIEERLYSYGLMNWEENICKNTTLDDLDPLLIQKYLSYRNERSLRNLRHNSQEELLKGLKCLEFDRDNILRPTNMGILMFGYDPQFHLPQSEVVCVRYADRLGVRRYIDRKNIIGTLPELIDNVENWLRINVKVGAVIEGFKRIDLPEYPLEALREAVVNAVVHRDYSLAGETIRVFIYPDRIEIHSPGLLVPGVTLEDLKKMKTISRPRNRGLAQFMRDIPGYMERIGGGIRLMVSEMQELNLPEPDFEEHHEFVVTFRGGVTVEVAGPEVEETLPSISTKLNERQLIGLQIVQKQGSISNSEYRAATKAPERTASRDLADMVEAGLLVTRGNKRSIRYFLA